MKLHSDKAYFFDIVRETSKHFSIKQSFIEKDYFITTLLHHLSTKIPSLLFKGGTSLSKCFKIIDRFSEDIDLTLEKSHQTQSQKMLMKKAIIDTCNELDLKITNIDQIRSRRDYNLYKIEYPIGYNSISINPLLLVETTYISKSYPDETRIISSVIYDFLKETGKENVIKKYELNPFPIRVQTLERTFIDKVFAICDYYISKNVFRNSRHIYDLYRLLTKVKLDDNLKVLIKKVRQERKQNSHSFSAQDDIDISNILLSIIDSGLFKEDYETLTRTMMFFMCLMSNR